VHWTLATSDTSKNLHIKSGNAIAAECENAGFNKCGG